jgi:hypothetical protein
MSGGRRPAWRRTTSLAVFLAVTGMASAAVGAGTAPFPRCFGAAARDPHHPCTNRHLRLLVTPTPDEALLTPNVPCAYDSTGELLDPCAFGAAPAHAVATVAVIGDSHAMHWRPALAAVAAARRWRVMELAHAHCPLTLAILDGRVAAGCREWEPEVVAWLAAHPEVHTVLVSAKARAPVVVPEGRTRDVARVDGYLRAWRSLPASIDHLIVIRDVPVDRLGTVPCIRRAMQARRPAGRACALPLRRSLRDDPATVAAHRLAARGARVVDLSHHFCSRRRCYPVVGGVLVHRDADHLTPLFAQTLGPYLLRKIDALEANVHL